MLCQIFVCVANQFCSVIAIKFSITPIAKKQRPLDLTTVSNIFKGFSTALGIYPNNFSPLFGFISGSRSCLRILFYLFFFSTVLTLPFGIYSWKNLPSHDWFLLALTALITFVSQMAITIGLRYGSPKALAPLCYTSVIFALMFDYLIWHTIPSWASVVGTALIIMGGITALFIENQ